MHLKLTSYDLKLIAISLMLIDHLGAFLFPDIMIFRYLGRIAFPLFAFMIAEGARYSTNRLKYLGRLTIFAIISEFPYDLINALAYVPKAELFNKIDLFNQTNIFYTLALALLSIELYETLLKKNFKIKISLAITSILIIFISELLLVESLISFKVMTLIILIILGLIIILLQRLKDVEVSNNLFNKFLAFIPILLILHLSYLLDSEYGKVAILMIFGMYLVRELRYQQVVMFIGLFLIYGVYVLRYLVSFKTIYAFNLWIYLFSLVAIILIAFYNGQRGKKTKWLFYCFYPVHLSILLIIKALMI